MQADIKFSNVCTSGLLSNMIRNFLILLAEMLYYADVSLCSKGWLASLTLHINFILLLYSLVFLDNLWWYGPDCALNSSWRTIYIAWAFQAWHLIVIISLIKRLHKRIDCFWPYRESLLFINGWFIWVSLMRYCLHVSNGL